MMADFNSSYLNHLKKAEKKREEEFMILGEIKKKPFIYPGEKLLRKYKHKIWHTSPHRKKIKRLLNEQLLSSNKSRYVRPLSNGTRNKNHSFGSSVLPDISRCKDFPISEIETELSGNRNNGNSPFSGSNSCGSPPDSMLLSKVEKRKATSFKNDFQKYGSDRSEQNNNTENVQPRCYNGEMKTKLERCVDSVISEGSVESVKEENTEKIPGKEIRPEEHYMELDSGNNGEAYIDVESLDESGEGKASEEMTQSEKVTEVFENGISDEPVQYVGSNVKHSQPLTQIAPVKWQQQFMSFLTSTTASEEDIEEQKNHHSPRRKRSRKVPRSMCPCCMGSGGHHRKIDRSDDFVRYRKSHSLIRDHRRFIRDMSQLVSLRNKVMAVCRILFPQCVSEVFNFANPDSEDVDKCIDQMISILHNAHQQFLHNLNSKSEFSRSANSHKKFKSEKSGRLRYDQLNSNEVLVSICDPSRTEEDSCEQVNSLPGDILQHPTLVFCSQPDHLSEATDEEQPVFTNLCLPGNSDGIVYAIPVENGIAYPEQTHVLLTGNVSQNLDFVNEFPLQDTIDNKEENNDHYRRVFSEADSGIVNDHDVSSPDTEKSVLYKDKSLLWSESKTSPISAKSETANIFDLFSKCETAHIKDGKHENISFVSNSSLEDKKSEIKTPAKTGDRNIFESLFGMNIESCISPVKCFSKDNALEVSDSLQKCVLENQVLPLKFSKDRAFETSLSTQMCIKNDLIDQICDQEIENLTNGKIVEANLTVPKETFIEVYDPAIILCKKPKICLRAFKEKISVLLRWLLPEIAFEKNFFKNNDNLEYVLDAVILSNQKETENL